MSNVRTPGESPQSIDPSTTTEPDLSADVEASDARVIAELPHAEQAAHYREMMSSLHRAVSAARKLGPIPEVETPTDEEEEGPITEPQRPYRGSLAYRSDGRVMLSVAYVEGADLTGYETWTGILLSPEQAEEVLDGISDAADDVGANIGGAIRWRKGEPEGSGGDGHE
jgi:hypothetical protein